MLVNAYRGYRLKIMSELRRAFHEEHTPHQIALSFSIGVFITALPTLGTGFIVFAVLMKMFATISKLALLSSVLVMNPFIKPLVYLASINLGGLIITRRLAYTTDPESVLTFLIVGNLIIAGFLSVLAYFFALRAVKKYREAGLDVVDEVEGVVEKEMDKIEAESPTG